MLARLGQQHITQKLLQDWIAIPTWTASFAFLEEHREELDTSEIRKVLAGSSEPVALQHAAILTLIEALPEQTVLELVTDPAAATDRALTALDNADLAQILTLVQANPAILKESSTGPSLRAVILLAAGHADQAQQAIAEAVATESHEDPFRTARHGAYAARDRWPVDSAHAVRLGSGLYRLTCGRFESEGGFLLAVEAFGVDLHEDVDAVPSPLGDLRRGDTCV